MTSIFRKQIKNDRFLVGENKLGQINNKSVLFPLMTMFCGRLLDNNPEKVLSEKSIRRRQKYAFPLFKKVGPLFLHKKHLIKEYISPLTKENRPIIFAPNHYFVEDAISTILVSDRHAYFFWGSLPQFFNTFNGIALYMNGSILVNRRDKASRHASVEKAIWLLENGGNLILYPEGVWNKTANEITLQFWSGIIKIARRTNALIIPIVHLSVGGDIHSSRLAPFDITQYPVDTRNEYLLCDLQDLMNTELWRLMDKYAQCCREDILQNYTSMKDACKHIVEEQVSTAGKYYDYPIETSSDYRKRGYITEREIWEPIAQLDISPQNADLVLFARECVQNFNEEDYQHSY